MKNYVSGTQKSSMFGVWPAPGAPDTTPKGGALEWLLGPPGPSRPPECMIDGSRKINLDDYIDTKLRLFRTTPGTRLNTGPGVAPVSCIHGAGFVTPRTYRPLSRALQKTLVFRFFEPAPGGSGGPREAPLSYPWAFLGPSGASRRPPGPKTNQSEKTRNLKELTEQWSPG